MFERKIKNKIAQTKTDPESKPNKSQLEEKENPMAGQFVGSFEVKQICIRYRAESRYNLWLKPGATT